MEIFGGPQFQILVSFVVIAGVAFVALICDFLKGNNEQLRELALEMRVRQESGQLGRPEVTALKMTSVSTVVADKAAAERAAADRAAKSAADKSAATQSLEKAIHRVAEKQASAPAAEAVMPKGRRDNKIAREAELAMERGNEIVAVRPRRSKSVEAPATVLAVPDIRAGRKAAMQSRLEGSAPLPAVADVSVKMENPVAPVLQPAGAFEVRSELPEIAEPKLSVDQKNLLDEILAATVANTPVENTLHRETGRGRTAVRADLFSSIESRVNRLESQLGPSAETEAAVDASPAARLQRAIEATQNPAAFAAARVSNGSELPAGLQDGFVLSKLLQSRKPVSGLVVSVGVGNSERKTGRIPEAVHTLIRSLLGADDFGCQSGEDEFLLIFPNEHGASAQRKLNAVAERLWDFQLRSMGSFSILFSWGGVEVNGEAISDAVNSASERMHETQRSRKVATIGPRQQVFVSEPAQRVAV